MGTAQAGKREPQEIHESVILCSRNTNRPRQDENILLQEKMLRDMQQYKSTTEV